MTRVPAGGDPPSAYTQAGTAHRWVRRAAASRLLSWLSARTLHHVDRLVHRLTSGRITFSSWVSGLPVVMLTTTGARTGTRRTAPLLGIRDGEAVVVIASNFGQLCNPGWYYNLVQIRVPP